MCIRIAQFALLFATSVSIAEAQQQPEPVFPGARIRVATAPDTRRVVGSLTALTPDSVVIKARARQAISRHQIASVEASRGRARWKWALVGAIAGAALGAATWKAEPKTDLDIYEDEYEEPGRVENALFVGLAGAALGALLAPERWRPASLSP